MRLKTISIATAACLFTTATFAAGVKPWSTSDLASYKAGTQVSEASKTFECKPWPYSGWCQNAAYEPTGTYGPDAWNEVGPGPSPTPTVDVNAKITVTGDIPAGTVIKFVGEDGTFTSAAGSTVTLKYPKDSSEKYTVSLVDDKGSISPTSITVSAATAQAGIALTYTAKPAPGPTPGKCDPIPATVNDFVPAGQGGFWSGYNKGAFIKFDGSIYENIMWNTALDPKQAPDFWELCEAVVQAQVSVKTDGLPQTVKSYKLTDGSESYTVNNGADTFTLAKGDYNLSAEKILSSDASQIYVPTVTPSHINVTKSENIDMTVKYQPEAVKTTTVKLTVNLAEGTDPKGLTATVTNAGGYSKQESLSAGDNTISLPSQGEFTVKPDSYTVGGTDYNANNVTIVDGKVQGDNTITYKNVDSMIAGYIDITATGSAQKVDVDKANADGYNTIIFAFAKIEGATVSDYGSQSAGIMDNDIAEAKKLGMKTLVSVGGANNLFEPNGADPATLAHNLVQYAQKNKLDGIDFDLEISIDPNYLYQIIKNIKEEDSSLIVTAAPQVNQGLIVTVGTSQDYTKTINAGLFDDLFFQLYNTGPQGDSNYISSIYPVLEKKVPSNTKIVIGEPVAQAAAGGGGQNPNTIFYNGGDVLSSTQASKIIKPQLAGIRDSSQFGGFMVWSMNVDYDYAIYANGINANVPHVPGALTNNLKDCIISGDCK